MPDQRERAIQEPLGPKDGEAVHRAASHRRNVAAQHSKRPGVGGRVWSGGNCCSCVVVSMVKNAKGTHLSFFDQIVVVGERNDFQEVV